jgi:hypothetical protein
MTVNPRNALQRVLPRWRSLAPLKPSTRVAYANEV